jgi:hypothetical protein
MNRIDHLKKMHLEEESLAIDDDFVDEFAKPILDALVIWSNQNIFSKIGGELALELMWGAPNAGVRYKSFTPLRPIIVFYRSLLKEIYMDARVFPIISRLLVDGTDMLAFQNEEPWKGLPFVFSTGVPILLASHVNLELSAICEEFASTYETESGGMLNSNDARCRFVMFELMLVWTFFHELGHVLQQHHRLKVSSCSTDKVDVFLEIPDCAARTGFMADTTAESGTADLAAQARELMADADAIDLTLNYLRTSERLCFPVVYLLYCSISCMYQRFYRHYKESLHVTEHLHPHPAVRQEVSEAFLTLWIFRNLASMGESVDSENAKQVVAYHTARSTIFTGMFRSFRIEERTGESRLPSYMRLLVEDNHQADLYSYLERLTPFVEAQIAKVREWHLMPENCMEEWLRGFNALRRNRGKQAQGALR